MIAALDHLPGSTVNRKYPMTLTATTKLVTPAFPWPERIETVDRRAR
jgi:hypothetical protein